MGTRLRLAAAGLTDVGRRRERNQDNTTHNVPGDEHVLAEKGALFVVCDGMGGHAAGEVASEIGVNTIRDEYYSTSHPDIITGIAHAIKAANERIFNYAREHAEMTGMGTTCVTLVIHGGRAYIVNIGDSRAYLIRRNAMRQVTMDHSWVAEQVRAGVLTEEQARTHAHRNVITRSLGTQPTVNADLFVETLQDGDRLLLCSDGLHGYVEEHEIEREVLRDDDPERSVRALVDMANDNGGPDNITAVVVHMLEVPPVTGDITLPNIEEQGITQPIPAVAAQSRSTGPIPAEPAAIRAEKRRNRPRRSGGARVALAAVRLLALAAIIVLGVGIWDVTAGPYGASRAAADRARADITSAHQAAAAAAGQDPQIALTALAGAQQRLVADAQSAQLDDQMRADAQASLANDVTPAVQAALQRYNAAALITPIPLGSLHTYPASCQQFAAAGGGSAPLADVTSFTALSPQIKAGGSAPSSQTLYAVSGGTIFQIVAPLDDTNKGVVTSGPMSCVAVSLPNSPAVIALAADGTNLYALAQQSAGFAVLAVSPSGSAADGTLVAKADIQATVPAAPGETPTAFAAAAGAWYVAYTGGASSPAGIWMFSGQTPKQPSATIALQQPATSLTASAGTLYAVLADGSLATAGSDRTLHPLTISLLPPLLKGDPADFSATAPVPTPAAGSANTTGPFGAGAAIAVNPRSPGELLIGDGTNSRIARVSTSSSAATATPSAQYVYGPPLDHAKLFTVAANASGLNFYVWNDGNLVGFSEPAPGA